MKIVIIDNKYTLEDSTDVWLNGIIGLLNKHKDTEVVDGFNDINEVVIDKLKEIEFDIILLDIDFPDSRTKGIDSIKNIKEKLPEAKIIIFSTRVNYKNIKNSITCRADGFFNKICDAEELVSGMKNVLSGQKFLCVSSTSILVNRIVAEELDEMDIKILTVLAFDPKSSNQRIDDTTRINRVIVGQRLKVLFSKIAKDKKGLSEWARKNIFTSKYIDEIKDFISENNSLKPANHLRDCPLKKCILNDFDSLWD